MRTCVYCQRTDPECGFNREHIIPQALGKFEGTVVTLTDEVCSECNTYFGRHLELDLNRDSIEAMYRFHHGLKDPAEVPKNFKHIRVRLPQDGSQWGGAYLDLVPPPPGERNPRVELELQVGFERRDGKGWEYFLPADVRDNAEHVKKVFTQECTLKKAVWGGTREEEEELLRLLAEKGIPFDAPKQVTVFPPELMGENVRARVEVRFDRILARGIAKIAFNYFTKVQGAEMALRPDFDAARRFVRYGEGSTPDFVNFGPAPELHNKKGQLLPARGHLMTLGWSLDDKSELLSRVCPFQHITYIVRLSRGFDGVWRPTDSVHLYDLGSKRVQKLEPITHGL